MKIFAFSQRVLLTTCPTFSQDLHHIRYAKNHSQQLLSCQLHLQKDTFAGSCDKVFCVTRNEDCECKTSVQEAKTRKQPEGRNWVNGAMDGVILQCIHAEKYYILMEKQTTKKKKRFKIARGKTPRKKEVSNWNDSRQKRIRRMMIQA